MDRRDSAVPMAVEKAQVIDEMTASVEEELLVDFYGIWAIVHQVRWWSYRNARPSAEVREVVSAVIERVVANGAVVVDLISDNGEDLTYWRGDDLHAQVMAWWDAMDGDPHLEERGWLYLPPDSSDPPPRIAPTS